MKLNDLLGRKDEKKIRIHRFSAFPEAFQIKFIKLAAFTFFSVLVATLAIYLAEKQSQEDLLYTIAGGVLLIGFCSYMTYRVYQMAATGDYDTYTGICTSNTLGGTSAVKLYSTLKKYRAIGFESPDGTAYVIYCKESKSIAKEGYPIKIYAPKTAKPTLVNGENVIYQYIAIESLGKKQVTGAQK